jgi:hypothetical protein
MAIPVALMYPASPRSKQLLKAMMDNPRAFSLLLQPPIMAVDRGRFGKRRSDRFTIISQTIFAIPRQVFSAPTRSGGGHAEFFIAA